jgi:hypothetical protein
MGAIVARQDNFHKTSLIGRLLPDRRLGEKSGVAGNPGRVTEMDNAVKGLTNGNEPHYYLVW